MELIKELLKAVAEYSQLNREEFLETVKKAQTSQPVSYTHLDVYKRQQQGFGKSGKGAHQNPQPCEGTFRRSPL